MSNIQIVFLTELDALDYINVASCKYASDVTSVSVNNLLVMLFVHFSVPVHNAIMFIAENHKSTKLGIHQHCLWGYKLSSTCLATELIYHGSFYFLLNQEVLITTESSETISAIPDILSSAEYSHNPTS